MSQGMLLLVAIFAGMLGSIAGVGGGVILIPAMTSNGVPIKQAIAISVFSIVAISVSAAAAYVKNHLANLRVSAFFELFAVSGAVVGASASLVSSPRLLFLLCGMIFLTGSLILWKQRKHDWEPVLHPDRLSVVLGLNGSYYDANQRRTVNYHGTHALLSGALMFGVGLITGLLGVGGTAFIALIQQLVTRLPPKIAVTTSNLVMGSMALVGASIYLEAGLIRLNLVIPVILGVALGAYLGSHLLPRFTNRIVRQVFLGILIIVGLRMILRALHGAP